MRNFPHLVPDQVQEQSNQKINKLDGATHLLNRPDSTGLDKWGTSDPEFVGLLSEFEEGINRPFKSQTVLPHHEDTPAFQQQFTFDVRRVFKNFCCNTFEQDGLVKAHNVNITYSECVHKALKTLFMKCESQFNEFFNTRFIRCEIPIDHKITKKVLSIPGRYEKNQNKSKKRLVYPATVLTKLRSSIDFRSTLSKELFKIKLFRVSQSSILNSQNLNRSIS